MILFPRSDFSDPAVFVPVFEVGVFGILFSEACLQHPYDIELCLNHKTGVSGSCVIDGAHFCSGAAKLLLESARLS